MSIKGTTKELYIGKSEVNLFDSKRKRSTIQYEDLEKINYWLADQENGKLIFIAKENQKNVFSFNDNANDSVIKAIEYIKDKRPKLPIELLSEEQRPKSKNQNNNNAKIRHQKCKNCGKEYDSETDICPYCNYSNTDTHFKWLLIGVIAIVIMSVIAYISNYFIF